MKKQTKTIIFLLMTGLLCSPGCDSNTHKTGPEKAARRFVFVDSSEGLPVFGQWREDIAFYDVNLDGYLDILAPPPRKAVEGQKRPFVWHGNSDGTWGEAPLNVPDMPYDYGGIAVGDFDGDGTGDIALAIHGKGVRVLKGKGGGEYVDCSGGLPSKESFMSRALVSLDMNNDGISDIAALSEGTGRRRSGAVIFYRSSNTWKTATVGSERERNGLYGDHLAVGDVNGDGNMDVAVGSLNTANSRIVWIGDGKGGFTPFNKGLPEGKHYMAVDLADLDGDGRDDLVASITGIGRGAESGLRAFLSTPNGFSDISEGLRTNDIFTAVKACDLDGDGSVDIVGATGKGGLKIFSQKGSLWREATVSGLPEKGLVQIYNVHCIDLDKDGRQDIVVNYGKEEGNSGGIRVFLNRTSPD